MKKTIGLVAGVVVLASCGGSTGSLDQDSRRLEATAVYTIWPTTAQPAIPDAGPDKAVELGVKFRADTSGSITGVRFYKAGANTGTHVANLWTSTGTRLATATFAGETASGWQQVSFPTPVAIAANTVYVASYHTNVGHYAEDTNTFAGQGVDSPPLHALAGGVAGVNGVYAYGSTSKFPTRGWKSSNYWVDVVFSTTVATDATPPAVTSFTLPATASTLVVPITSFTATDDVGVTGYLATETAAAPSPTATGWSATAPASYAFASAGTKTLYGWARDAAGNVSASSSASVVISLGDVVRPTVTAFTLPATASTLIVPITSFTATDDVGVTGYLATETAAAPSPTATGWSATAPASYAFASAGARSLYGWARDAAGNVSASRSASVTITLSTAGPEPAGWYAGDMHVHRSCGGSPDSISSVFQLMAPQNLAVMSLLADMGNAEVQNAAQDLPRVNGQDDALSTPGRILHWDAEWHWDPVYTQYAHQALGGHILALGVSEAHQIWEEYTSPIFDWAHQRGGIAGFAHMQYLDDAIPQDLDCCTPLEYPVEVALGSSDFISEDVVDGSDSWGGMNPESAIRAYYRLLNCGFRPGLAAGTDFPCNGRSDPGSLLTYVQVSGGQMTYRNWIDGIARGRTVVSRNGHREFLNLVVNGNAAPGDEVALAAAGSVPVVVQWTAAGSLTGTIEIVSNGVVVASKQTSVSAGAPATLSATIAFPKSGWVAARRMANAGHQIHTAAVFVTVANAPVRASAADANFYVQWMDNLLQKTSRGGAWSSYFSTSLGAAQARYQAARAIYQQIATEAGGGGSTEPTIFTTQTPTQFDNDAAYELGTLFWADVAGQITQVRVYTSAQEGGSHVVRIWRVSDRAVVAGPYTWSIASGTEGWKTFPLPAPLGIAASTDYIVAISNSSDLYYAEQAYGFDAPIVNGHLHTYAGSGVYTAAIGAMPTATWNNANYFRDVVFEP